VDQRQPQPHANDARSLGVYSEFLVGERRPVWLEPVCPGRLQRRMHAAGKPAGLRAAWLRFRSESSVPHVRIPHCKYWRGDPKCKPLVLGADNGPGQACIDAANGEVVNAAMNAQVPGSSSGLASLQRLGCYVSPNGRSLILPPAQGTFGTMGKDALFAAAFYEWDFSVSKRWRLRDRVGVQFRAEFFNFLNNRTYAGIGSITNPATFGLATSAPNAPVIRSTAPVDLARYSWVGKQPSEPL
jgi:hypothetical protein